MSYMSRKNFEAIGVAAALFVLPACRNMHLENWVPMKPDPKYHPSTCVKPGVWGAVTPGKYRPNCTA